MAPRQQLTVVGMTGFMPTAYNSGISKRDLTQNINPVGSEMVTIVWASFAFAIVSLISALFAFYWFVRMRRGFRQDMIMLLIQSDMAKALWLLVSPLFYVITGKPFGSSWAFCQVSGFFLTVTIEAADIAVLLIAIHTALFVVKRQYPAVAVGPQPYRRVAYMVWAVVPFILAAVVPITGGSFADNGPRCYLPVRPGWYLNALAWVPRYIIVSFTIVTHTWLYLYVYLRCRSFEEDQRWAGSPRSRSDDSAARRRARRRWRSHSVPPTPSLLGHKFLNNTPQGNTSKEGVRLPARPAPVVARQGSIAWNPIDLDCHGSRTPRNPTPCIEKMPASSIMHASTTPHNDDSNSNIVHIETIVLNPSKQPAQMAKSGVPLSGNLHSTRYDKWKRRFTGVDTHTGRGPRNSPANIIAAPRQEPPGGTGAGAEEEAPSSSPSSPSSLSSPLSSAHLANEVSKGLMPQPRDRMRHQIRLLFVYPAIYILTWAVPFGAHVYQHNGVHPAPMHSGITLMTSAYSTSTSSAANGTILVTAASQQQAGALVVPLTLRIASVVSLCIGAAVDCVFFCVWERPWRHLRGGFWENLAVRLRVHRVFDGLGGGGGLLADSVARGGPGRNHDERIVDEKAARMRRKREREELTAARESRSRSSGGAGCTAAAAAGTTAAGAGVTGSTTTVTAATTPAGASQTGRRREWWDALDELAGW